MAALPFDRFPALASTDLDETRSVIWRYMGEHSIELVDPSSGLNARINGRLVDRMAASFMSFGADTRTEPGELGFYLVQLVLSGTYMVRQGQDEAVVPAGGAVVLSPNEHVTTRWSADCGVLAYEVRAPDFVGHLSGLLGEQATVPLRFDLVMDMRGPARDLRSQLLLPLARQLNHDYSKFDDPIKARQAEDTLMTALLRAQPNTYSAVLERALRWPKR